MVRDNDKPKVDDESSSKSDSVIGRGDQEGIGSDSFTRASNFEEGSSSSSSSHNHINNLEEHQRLMMLRINQHMHQLTDDPSSTKKAPVYPPGSRFLPTDLGCVRVHLRNKVEKNKSGFITTLDVYKDDPWLLDHVQNDLFPRGEWYYFTPRNKRGATSCNRTVWGRGGGGTWKTTSKKESIKDKNNKVEGYMQSLVYNKSTNIKGDKTPTGWNMKEYCFHEDNQDDLVLCRLKGNLKNEGFAEEVKTNNILWNQVQDHEEEEAGANRVKMRTLQEDHGDATQPQQRQQQEQDAPVRRSLEGQDLGLMTTHNNLMTMVHEEDHGDATQQQQQRQLEQDAPVLYMPPYEGQDSRFETMSKMQNDFMTMLQMNHSESSTKQQQPQEQDAPPVHESHELAGFETMTTTHNNLMTVLHEEDHGDATQQQQQQDQDAVAHEGEDIWFETNNLMAMLDDGNQQCQWDDSDLYFDGEEYLNSMYDDANGQLKQTEVSQAVKLEME